MYRVVIWLIIQVRSSVLPKQIVIQDYGWENTVSQIFHRQSNDNSLLENHPPTQLRVLHSYMPVACFSMRFNQHIWPLYHRITTLSPFAHVSMPINASLMLTIYFIYSNSFQLYPFSSIRIYSIFSPLFTNISRRVQN